jgi:cytochrome b pre-mRNA-processing protein 3
VKGLDDAFREIGVSDTAVGKKMKKLAGAFYGR